MHRTFTMKVVPKTNHLADCIVGQHAICHVRDLTTNAALHRQGDEEPLIRVVIWASWQVRRVANGYVPV